MRASCRVCVLLSTSAYACLLAYVWLMWKMTSYVDFASILIALDSDCVFLPCSESEKQFEILLIGATGGAILGRHLVSKITIAKSDSPFGIIRFLNQSKISVPNPNSTMALHLVLEDRKSVV